MFDLGTFKSEKPIYKIMTLAILASVVFFLCRIIYAGIIMMPYPKELLEASNIALTNLFIEGKNPYSLASFDWEIPAVNYNYPFLNSLLAAGIAKITGIGAIRAHFTVSLVSIILSGIMGFLLGLRCARTTVAPALVSILYMLCHWRYGYISASPDDLGLTLFMLTSYICVSPKVKNKSLICAILITLCFYTKQYFVFIAIALFIYMLLYSKQEAWRCIIWTVVINILAATAVTIIFPLYWTRTVVYAYLGTAMSGGFDISNLLSQIGYLLAAFTALFVILLIAAATSIVQIRKSGKKLPDIKINGNDPVAMFAIQIPVMLLPLIYLGSNDGSFITYFLQLWMPSVVFVAVISLDRMIAQRDNAIRIALYALVAFCSIYFGFGKLPLHILTAEEIAEWDKAIEYIDRYGRDGKVFYDRCLAYESFTRNNGDCLCGHDGEVINEYWNRRIQVKADKYLPYVKYVSNQNMFYHMDITEKAKQHKYSLITFYEPQCYHLFDDSICESMGYKCVDKLMLRLGNMPYEVAFFIPQ